MENNLKKFISLVVDENLAKAQDFIKETLNEKLNSALSDKFEEYAPSVFEATKPDFLDLDGDGDTEEPMKKAAEEAEGEDGEDVEEDEEQSEEEEEGETEDEDAEEDEEESEEDEEEQD